MLSTNLVTAKNSRPYVHRAGFHACVSHYTGSADSINRFSGTCLNRQIRENEKKRIQAETEILKATQERTLHKLGGMEIEAGDVSPWVYTGLPRRVKQDRVRNNRARVAARRRGISARLFFSERTRRIVKDKATAFYRSAGRKKIFCTLTFINEPATDADAVAVLNKFLTILRREHENLQYLWVAERQTDNNNRIHFHLIINTRIGIKRFNGLWVLQQYNAGIIHEKHTRAEILERFEAGTMQEIFNPVDVKTVRNIGVLAGYLSKYVTKGNNKNGFGCRVWHCSRGVSALITKQVVPQECIEVAKSFDNCVVDKKTGEVLSFPRPMADTDGRGVFYTVWRINQPGRFLCYLREMEQLNKWIISAEFQAKEKKQQIVEYLKITITPDRYRAHYLN